MAKQQALPVQRLSTLSLVLASIGVALCVYCVLAIARPWWMYSWVHTYGLFHSLLFLAMSGVLLWRVRSSSVLPPGYRPAVGALIASQLLTVLSALLDAPAYTTGADAVGLVNLVAYIVICVLANGSLALLVVRQLSYSQHLRLDTDMLLVIAIADITLRVGLPALILNWPGITTITASTFRLVMNIGLVFWYVRVAQLYLRGRSPVLAFWAFGLVCLLLTDVALIVMTYLTYYGHPAQETNFVMVPWLLHHFFWTVGLVWAADTMPSFDSAERRAQLAAPIALLPARQGLVLIALAVLLVSGLIPSVVSMVWFVAALVTREMVVAYDHALFLRKEREAKRSIEQAHAMIQERDAIRAHEVAAAVHDLRHGLARTHRAVHHLATEAAETRLSEGRLRMHRQRVSETIAASSRLLSTWADAVYLEHNKLSLRVGPLDLGHLVAQVVQQREWDLDELQIQVTLDRCESTVLIVGDEDRLARVLHNLLDNALTYTSRQHPDGGGRVLISVGVHGNDAVCTLRDNGRGISPDDLQRIVRPFVRGQQAAGSGMGLGLAVSTAIVEQTGGNLVVESDGEGMGTIVRMVFPCAADDARDERTLPAGTFVARANGAAPDPHPVQQPSSSRTDA